MKFSPRKALQIYRQRKALRSLLNNYLLFSDNTELSLWGSLSEGGCEELLRLVRLAAQFDGPIIEIGTLFGLTAQVIANAKRADQQLISIDNYSWNPFCLPPSHHREFTRRVLHYCLQRDQVQLYEGDSDAFLSAYDGKAPAMIFLDGSHEYRHVAQEIRHARRLKAHIICGDDYNEAFPGLIRAVKEEGGTDVAVHHSIWSLQLQ